MWRDLHVGRRPEQRSLGSGKRDTFDLSRIHYGRVGHLALGVFPCFTEPSERPFRERDCRWLVQSVVPVGDNHGPEPSRCIDIVAQSLV